MTEQDASAEADVETRGIEPKIVIVDEAQGIYDEITEKDVLEVEVEELMKMSALLDDVRGNRRGSPKVKDKKRTRAKSKKARISRRANRG